MGVVVCVECLSYFTDMCLLCFFKRKVERERIVRIHKNEQ